MNFGSRTSYSSLAAQTLNRRAKAGEVLRDAVGGDCSECAQAADSFFAPAVVVFSDKLKLAPDVAGATLLALGNGAADFFTQIAAITSSSEVGGWLRLSVLRRLHAPGQRLDASLDPWISARVGGVCVAAAASGSS